MTESTIETTTNEVAGSYDDNPNVSQSVGESSPSPQDAMPWLLRDKFKGESDVDIMREQAKAYPELQNKMGKWWGAPKDSDYDMTPLKEFGFTPEDPILVGMKDTFKEMGLSNEAVKKLASSYDNSLKSMTRQMEERLQKEMTPDFAEAAKRAESWISKFAKPDQEIIKSWLQTKEDFKMLDTIRAMNPNINSGSMNVPAQGASYGNHRYESSAQVESEKVQNFQRYNKDPAYRADVAQRYRDAKTRELKG